MKTLMPDEPREIVIGALRVTRIRPDRVRVYNEHTGDSLEMGEGELEDVLLMAVECR